MIHWHSVKRVRILILCLVFLFAAVGCTEERQTTNAQNSHQEPSENLCKVIDDIQVIESTRYFMISEKNGLYAYKIYSESGDVVKNENSLTSKPHIAFVDDHMVEVITQAGTGVGTQSGFYYDIANDRFSDIYQSIMDQQGGFVVYATEKSIIVRDIFDEEELFLELCTFSHVFSDAAFPFVSAAFSEDGFSIMVTYLTGEDYEEVTEVFEMCLQ